MLMMLMLLLLLDLDLIGTTTSHVAAALGGGESGVEDSEEEDEEWNYIKVEDKKSQNELSAVDENIIEQPTAPFIEEKQTLEEKKEELIEEEPPTAPIEFASKEFEFNVSICKLNLFID